MLKRYAISDGGTGAGLLLGSRPGFYLPIITTHSVVVRAGTYLAADQQFQPQNSDLLAKHTDHFKPFELSGLDEIAGVWQQAPTVHFAEGGLCDQINQPSREVNMAPNQLLPWRKAHDAFAAAGFIHICRPYRGRRNHKQNILRSTPDCRRHLNGKTNQIRRKSYESIKV